MPPGTVQWALPGPGCEIRTVIFNLAIEGEQYHMWYRGQRASRDLSVQEFGLRAADTDAHVPQFLLLTKSKEDGTTAASRRSIFHARSEQGKARDNERKNRNRAAKREAERAEAAANNQTAASPSWEPMPQTKGKGKEKKDKGKGTKGSWHSKGKKF